MKIFFLAIAMFVACTGFGQSKDETAIRKVLNDQAAAWNRGNIEEYMQGYWKNDSLTFIGKSGVTKGWQKTLSNYKRGYPDTAAMGKLSFDILSVKQLSSEYYYIIGKWMLKRTKDDVSGHFDLLFRKIKGQWLIVSDHSS
jgi:ketosteroid isomerase-like protein